MKKVNVRDIAEETCGVLHDKFGFSDERIRDSWERIVDACRMIPYALPPLDAVPDDPDDNRIVECAVEAKSEVIVTGDKHLLR